MVLTPDLGLCNTNCIKSENQQSHPVSSPWRRCTQNSLTLVSLQPHPTSQLNSCTYKERAHVRLLFEPIKHLCPPPSPAQPSPQFFSDGRLIPSHVAFHCRS